MNWFTQLPMVVQLVMIAAVSGMVITALLVFYKSKFKVKDGDKEFEKEAPEDDEK